VAIVAEAAVIVAAVAAMTEVEVDATSYHVVVVVVVVVVALAEDEAISFLGAITRQALAEDRYPFVVPSGEVDLSMSNLAYTCKLDPQGSKRVFCGYTLTRL
jgi:hypothetical protein